MKSTHGLFLVDWKLHLARILARSSLFMSFLRVGTVFHKGGWCVILLFSSLKKSKIEIISKYCMVGIIHYHFCIANAKDQNELFGLVSFVKSTFLSTMFKFNRKCNENVQKDQKLIDFNRISTLSSILKIESDRYWLLNLNDLESELSTIWFVGPNRLSLKSIL